MLHVPGGTVSCLGRPGRREPTGKKTVQMAPDLQQIECHAHIITPKRGGGVRKRSTTDRFSRFLFQFCQSITPHGTHTTMSSPDITSIFPAHVHTAYSRNRGYDDETVSGDKLELNRPFASLISYKPTT